MCISDVFIVFVIIARDTRVPRVCVHLNVYRCTRAFSNIFYSALPWPYKQRVTIKLFWGPCVYNVFYMCRQNFSRQSIVRERCGGGGWRAGGRTTDEMLAVRTNTGSLASGPWITYRVICPFCPSDFRPGGIRMRATIFVTDLTVERLFLFPILRNRIGSFAFTITTFCICYYANYKRIARVATNTTRYVEMRVFDT